MYFFYSCYPWRHYRPKKQVIYQWVKCNNKIYYETDMFIALVVGISCHKNITRLWLSYDYILWRLSSFSCIYIGSKDVWFTSIFGVFSIHYYHLLPLNVAQAPKSLFCYANFSIYCMFMPSNKLMLRFYPNQFIVWIRLYIYLTTQKMIRINITTNIFITFIVIIDNTINK